MSKLIEIIREFLSNLFGGSDKKRLKALDKIENNLQDARRNNEDRLQDLKKEIKSLEARALYKKAELEKVKGESAAVIVGEIERVFSEIDQLNGKRNVIEGNLNRIILALSKTGEGKAAIEAGISEKQLDDIALEIQELFSDLKTMDRAAADLERENYEKPSKEKIDVGRRMAEAESQDVSMRTLTPEIEERLKKLDTVQYEFEDRSTGR